MNEIILQGIVRNIRPSHTVNCVDYYQADVITQRKDKKEDSVIIKFKKHMNKYKELDRVELTGQIRSYTEQLENGKNKVHVYVFTYQDFPTIQEDVNNKFTIDGRICKINELRITSKGKKNIHFTLANNIFTNNGQKINNYLPVTCWGGLATKVNNMLVGDKLIVTGELHSRTYFKLNENGEKEYNVAYELLATHIEEQEEVK